MEGTTASKNKIRRILMKTIILTFLTLGAVQIFAAPCTTGTYNGAPAVLLTESPESQGEPAIPFCTVPAGFATTPIPFAVALNDAPAGLPPVIGDLIVFAPTGLITFYSDPFIPTDIAIDLLQTEAAQNIATVGGTTYVIVSDVGGEMPEVPEPSTLLLLPAGVGLLTLCRRWDPSFLRG
jgi:hypothetical protein